MNEIEDLLAADQFSIDAQTKGGLLAKRLRALTEHHFASCPPYRRIIERLWPHWRDQETAESLPFLPARVFKSVYFSSVPPADVFVTIQSSGTSGQAPSRIPLDRRTAQLQSCALAAVLRPVLGSSRLPLLIIDRPSELQGVTARSVGIRGMLPMSRRHAFALKDDLSIDAQSTRGFLGDLGDTPFFIFGFTFLVWRFVSECRNHGLDLSKGVLIHSGGWKRLTSLGITNERFKTECADAAGIRRVHNFYGMAEQVGSVFLEDPDGHLRAPACAEVIVRDPSTWQPLPPGQPGILQVLSALPESYPGHSILTEDLGVVHPNAGHASMTGTSFSVLGRLPRAELRGCSDVAARAS